MRFLCLFLLWNTLTAQAGSFPAACEALLKSEIAALGFTEDAKISETPTRRIEERTGSAKVVGERPHSYVVRELKLEMQPSPGGYTIVETENLAGPYYPGFTRFSLEPLAATSYVTRLELNEKCELTHIRPPSKKAFRKPQCDSYLSTLQDIQKTEPTNKLELPSLKKTLREDEASYYGTLAKRPAVPHLKSGIQRLCALGNWGSPTQNAVSPSISGAKSNSVH